MTFDGTAQNASPDPELAGAYHVVLDTPSGEQEVDIELKVDGTRLDGSVEFAGALLHFQNGQATTEGFYTEGEAKIMLMTLKASVKGRRVGETILGSVETNLGIFAFSGTKKA